jgi:hypothetical protein
MEKPSGFVTYSNLVLSTQEVSLWFEVHKNGDTLIVVVYMDDLLITNDNNDLIIRLKK